jgi:hypothetical protein
MLGIGRLLCRALTNGDDPFLAFVLGFLLLAYGLAAADLIAPGAHWQVVALLGLAGLPGWRGGAKLSSPLAASLGLLIGLFTFTWCADIAPRLADYYATGRFSFWVDMFAHAGSLARFASDDAIGRGMASLADVPAPLYHYASFLPAALFPRLAGVPLLDAIILVWLPLGVLVMAAGVASLGLALGGPRLAAVAFCGLALMPAPSHYVLNNGFLNVAWLLETSPGAPYSVGVACAALAALVRWTRDQRLPTLAIALIFTAGCLLVRINTFVWLAPTVVLSAVAGWRQITPATRAALVTLGLLGLAALFAILSWAALRSDPMKFLFGYIEFVHQSNPPTGFDGLYPGLIAHLGRTGAALAGWGLVLLGTLGLWLPALAVLGTMAIWRRQADAADAIPFLLLAVAAIAIVLAPAVQNGDISEFRHRPGPLLVAVEMIWTLRFAALALAPVLVRAPGKRIDIVIAGVAALCLCAQYAGIGAAKRPSMAWARGGGYFDIQTAPGLLAIAPLLTGAPETHPRFAVAGQPPEARDWDDATCLIALSGTPAYISRPAIQFALGGAVGDEAHRRMGVLARLAQEPDLEALRGAMRAEGVTHYVVTKPSDVSFDPERRGAIGRYGPYAVYRAEASGP